MAQSYQINNGDTWYCKVSNSVQHTTFSRQEDRTYKITVTSRQKTGNYFLDITLLHLKVTDVQGGRKTLFDAASPQTWEYNDSRLYNNPALLQQVVRITLNRNGEILEIWNLDSLKIKDAHVWHLSKSMEENLAYNIGMGLQASLQALFPPLPVQQEPGFSWQQNNITYTVTKGSPESVSIIGNAVHKGGTTFASTPQAEQRPYVSLTEISYVAGKNMSMLQYYQSSVIMRNDPAREEKGRADMEAHHYVMPVLLSDNKVQGNYKINGYPTKVLISPEGKMVPVTFGQDYKAILESFATIAEDPVAGKAIKTQVTPTNN